MATHGRLIEDVVVNALVAYKRLYDTAKAAIICWSLPAWTNPPTGG